MTNNEKYIWGLIGLSLGCFTIGTVISQYNTNKERALREKKIENDKLYFEKLTPEQVERIELEKVELKKKEVELRLSEAELKKTVTEFEAEICESIQNQVIDDIHDDMRKIFDTWSAKYEDRLDNKVDRVVSRIDALSDKYGGVKACNTAPSISVVNAQNN